MLFLFCSAILGVVVTESAIGKDPYILVGRREGIDRLNMDGTGREEIIALKHRELGYVFGGLDYDYEQNYLFYLAYPAWSRIEIRRCSLSGQNDQLVVSLTISTGHNFNVDRRRQRIYRMAGRGHFFIEDYDGSAATHKNLLEIPVWADDFAVAPMIGKLFWTTRSVKSLVSADLDGSDIKAIFPGGSTINSNGARVALAVNQDETKLYFGISYWEAENAELHSLDLVTGIEETLLTGIYNIRDIWPHDDHIFFTTVSDSIMRCDKSGSGLVTIASGFSSLYGITVVQPTRTNLPAPVDGAWSAWGPWSTCSTTCGSGHRGRARSCDNPKPAHGGSFCVGPDKQTKECNNGPCASYDYILFARGGGTVGSGVSRMNLDGTEVSEIINLTAKFGEYKGILALDYNPNENALCYATAKRIRRCTLSGENDQLVTDEPFAMGYAVAYNNLALRPDVTMIYATTTRSRLLRYDYHGTHKQILIPTASGASYPGFHDVVVSTVLGRIFFTAHQSANSIWSADLYGGDLIAIRTKVIGTLVRWDDSLVNAARGLALDEEKKKLYFGVNPDTYQNRNINNELHVIDLDTGVETTLLTGLVELTSLQLHKGRIYFPQSSDFGRVQSCDTNGNDLRTHFEDYYIRPRAIKIVTIVDAPWSDWSVWTTCTETCGDGIRTRTRTCTGAQCYGQSYEIQECNKGDCAGSRLTGWEERKNKAICVLFTSVPSGAELFGVSSVLPVSVEVEDEVLSCKEECGLQSMTCARSLRLYASPADRLAQREEQVHVYERCGTKWANICCCLN